MVYQQLLLTAFRYPNLSEIINSLYYYIKQVLIYDLHWFNYSKALEMAFNLVMDAAAKDTNDSIFLLLWTHQKVCHFCKSYTLQYEMIMTLFTII